MISNLARIQILAANIKPQTNTALRELQNILEVTCSSSDDCFKWMAVGGLWPISGDYVINKSICKLENVDLRAIHRVSCPYESWFWSDIYTTIFAIFLLHPFFNPPYASNPSGQVAFFDHLKKSHGTIFVRQVCQHQGNRKAKSNG